MSGFKFGIFSPKALKSIHEPKARLNIWQGSVRSGKTINSIIAWIKYIKIAPTEGRLIMVGKTERTLKKNILDIVEQIVGSQNFRYNRGLGECYIFGRVIDIVGANDERSENKIRGMTCAGAYCDELTLYPESFFKMLLSRLSVKGSKLFGTTNPDSPYHWLKVGYLDNDKLDLNNYHFELDDNPNLDPEYVKQIKLEYSGLWYQRFILGLWVLSAGIIYDCFNHDNHVIDKLPDTFDRYYIGIDYGTNNPCVFLLVGFTKGNYTVIKEYYHDGREKGQKTDNEYALDLVKFIGEHKINKIFLDPSALSFKTELRKHKIYVTQANNDVLNGIRAVSSIISQDRLKVYSGCKNILKEFASYIWDEKASLRGEDKPVKQSDHALDSLKYLIFTLESKSAGLDGFKGGDISNTNLKESPVNRIKKMLG